MTTENTEALIREARLIVARPEQVLAELEKYGDELKSRCRDDENLERSLLARNEPLIDLGLARYAQEKEVVASLYQKSRANPMDLLQERYLLGLRIACLSNEVVVEFLRFPEDVFGKEEFARLITEGDEEELAALFSNPNLADETLEALYKNEGLFAALPDERRHVLVYLSSYNPRLITNKDYPEDPDLGYWNIHRAFITMLASVPTTEYWLSTLRQMLDRFDPGDLPSPEEPITPILERWAQAPVSEKDRSSGYFTALSRRDEFRCLIAAIYGRHYYREKDDKFTSSILGSPDSPDVVLRCAYYGKAQLTEKEMEDGFFRDEDVYLLAVLYNDSVYYKPALRKLLEEEQLRGEDLWHVYRRRCEQIHKRRPAFDPRPVSEWLMEEYPSENKEMAMLKQLESRVASIDSAIKSVRTWISWGFVVLGTLVLLRGH